MNICEQCGYYLKISSSDRIELSVDPGTWDPMDDGMVSLDPIEFHSEEEPYKDRIYSYQKKTGLTEAVQTGTGQLNGIPVAIGVMDFQFMGGSMGSVVGEKITRLIEYATNKPLPLILVITYLIKVSSERLVGPKQAGFENPREATGRIVCANCHLANKPVILRFRKRSGYSKQNHTKRKRGYEITITDALDGRQVVDIIPPGPDLRVSEGESIKLDQPLTSNPNVGGFGQGDAEIVLQDPLRVQGLLFFLASVVLAQIFLVLKKKQFEKVQLSEMNF
ncbi:hypothetical protein Ddye_032718 [Dipteronia dyeriana]|uniref:Cytochrome f n=1 Tax=Dipteronia dyeriana TaxID=168575 RepID=A0AAD9WJQ4_9ROSI|nr:hypothetical protein Ddye_032718 [Dipteronia dyeriana]